MTTVPEDQDWESRLKGSLGVAPVPDFAAWGQRHAGATQYLNPVVTARSRRGRRALIFALQAVAALLLVSVGVSLFRSGVAIERSAFAEAIRGVDDAQTITWTSTAFLRLTSEDGKRTWLRAERQLHAYRQPGLYRVTSLDQEGNPSRVSIWDIRKGRELVLEPKENQAELKVRKPMPDYRGPFAWVGEALRERQVAGGRFVKSIELVGTRPLAAGRANVVRVTYRDEPGQEFGADDTDFWIDAATKQLVAIHSPGTATFDPDTAADRSSPAESASSSGEIVGHVESEIVLGAQLDADLFSLEAPDGFKLTTVPRPTVNEDDMIEYLGAAARFNGGAFPDRPEVLVDAKALNAAWSKDRQDRSDVEQRMIELSEKYLQREIHDPPLHRFEEDHVVPKSFYYVGTGVKIGQADRIVCWYKLKSSEQYRAVFGDLTVRAVSPKDLPLPVDP